MEYFYSQAAANEFVGKVVDTPVTDVRRDIKDGVSFSATSIDLGNGRFANSYDVSFESDRILPHIGTFDVPTSTFAYMSNMQDKIAAISGGFFYLVDKASGRPRHLALNLSMDKGNLHSLPVVDRETVLVGSRGLEARRLPALGNLSLDGHELDWSGSLTAYDTPVKAYGNGNVAIKHQSDAVTGNIRELDETSRYTNIIDGDDFVDIGFVGTGGKRFVSTDVSYTGRLDIFAHDIVLRCPRKYARLDNLLEVHTIGSLALDTYAGGALTGGPMLDTEDFNSHPINSDSSLGSKPSFRDVRIARTVLYKTDDDKTHLRLFDGRPGSESFAGVTPTEAAEQILSERNIIWGCFLDGGQSAKLCVNRNDTTEGYGNKHYLKWPDKPGSGFEWEPDTGRPVASVIAV